ncbi:MAG: YcgN family cysteine cluster protein [Ghiorsea sp.]
MSTRWHSHINDEDWEALCDGCGQCCMHKFEDEDTGEILNTDVACALFDSNLCKCKKYETRFKEVPACMHLREMSDDEMVWLPETCAYRLTFEGKDLPSWHPLISGVKDTVFESGISMQGRCVSELDVPESSLIEHVIEPVVEP